MKKISDELKCVRCGCSDVRFLEFNHKNGGGAKEFKHSKHQTMLDLIMRGGRKTNDLELLCRPCNHIHSLELKYKQNIPLITVFLNNDWESEL